MKKTASWVTVVLVAGVWAACGGDDSKGAGGATGGAAGMGGGGGLELVSRTPGREDENVWAFAPIQLEFSHALDPASLAGALRLEAQGEPLPFTATFDDSGRILTLTLDEIPPLPGRFTLNVDETVRSADGLAFAGDAWSWNTPLWQAPAAPETTFDANGGVGLTALANREVVVAVTGGGGVQVARLSGATWADLPPVDLGASAQAARVLGLFGTELDGLTLAWLEQGASAESVHVARFDGSAWQPVGGGPAATGSGLTPQVRVAPSGAVLVLYRSSSSAVSVRRATSGEWAAVGSDLAAPGEELSLALGPAGEPLVAYVDGEGAVQVAHFTEGAWSVLGSGIDRERTGAAEPQLVWADGEPVLAYVDGDEVSTNVQVARFDGTWRPLGAALDVELDAQASRPRLWVDGADRVVAAWREKYGSEDRVFVARRLGADWQVLGPAAGQARGASAVALGADADDFVHVAWVSGAAGESALQLRRFNGSPVLPYGLGQLGERGTCHLPSDGDPDFPETLTATGCYEDVTARRVVSAAIPFTINSPLWSDGADKRRYVLLPETNGVRETVDYVSAGALGFPVGTILIKEFYLQRVVGDPSSLFPVETRFLVKRCEEGSCASPWQGYSYQWNASGTEGTLLLGASPTSKAWAVSDDGTTREHVHLYPSRDECVLCHNAAAGRVLGLQSKQLNKPHDYGHTVDNQLRAWVAAGVFGTGGPDSPPEDLARLPKPGDVGRSLGERTRSYFHSNCGHCHRPEGINVAIDFRYEAPLSETNICDKLTPGDHSTSSIWIRDGNRGGQVPSQMPPLATDLPDTRQLSVTAAWIDSLGATCP
jgi:mono/diheme cytochrome c family protein